MIKMMAVGATAVEQHDGIEFMVDRLLNPKILREFSEDMNKTNMETLEGRWKSED